MSITKLKSKHFSPEARNKSFYTNYFEQHIVNMLEILPEKPNKTKSLEIAQQNESKK